MRSLPRGSDRKEYQMEDNSLFDMYKEEFSVIEFEPKLIKSQKDMEYLEILREDREKNLSPFAFKTANTRGREKPETDCFIRTCYERDMGRIIFSQSFRRMRHKTQVFFNPLNDHICSRIEHVIYVNYISTIIARALNLNVDLVQAIALGHDIGHAPFGHSGERILDKCIREVDESEFFEHEQQSLRVLDRLEEHSEGKYGLNISFEVRDGIVSHCGETYDEISLKPFRDKETDAIVHKGRKDRTPPATLEGCVVRFADKVAYVGRDMEDALRAGFISSDYLSGRVKQRLGNTNSEVINTLVGDIIHNSLDKDEICMSEEIFEATNEFLKKNVEQIYMSKKIMAYERNVTNIIESLFEAYMEAACDIEKAKMSSSKVIRDFAEYYCGHPESDAKPVRKIADYISGMTDTYCSKCFDSLFRI